MEIRYGILGLMGVLLILATGCSLGSVQSASTRLFTLTPTVDPTAEAASPSDDVIGIGPVTLADYLDRPQIITRTSPHELKASEFSQWAEPLKSNIARVIRENVSTLTGSERVFSFPWRRSMQVDHQITVNVLRFDASSGGRVTLVVHWAVYGENTKEFRIHRRSTIESQASGTGYDAIAEAMSRALGNLSREMVAGLSDIKTGV